MKNKRIKKYVSKIITILFGLFIISWVIWGSLCAIGNYGDNVYQLDRVDDQFTRAHGTNNLGTFADYTQTGLDMLSRYSGNEAWWYPTIKTDMDSIKIDIQLIIDNARLAENITTYGSDAYQEALDNAKESLSVQMTRLEAVQWLYLGVGKMYIGLVWGWITVLIVAIILLIIAWECHYNINY